MTATIETATCETAAHTVITPSVLYFGTPISLLSTCNPDGTPNLAPMSSTWYLGQTVVLGIGLGGQTIDNVQRTGELVINLPSAEQADVVERLAPLTGRAEIPAYKQRLFRHEPRKFEAAGVTPVPSELVGPPRVAECPVQLEAAVLDVRTGTRGGFAIVEAEVLRVHVRDDLVIPGTHHVDTARWKPLLYVFRHYVAAGEDVGRSFRAEA